MKFLKEHKLIFIILLVSLLLRLLFITIDSPAWSTGDLGLFADEGYKTLSARNQVLFDTTHPHPNDSYPGWSRLSPVSHGLFTLIFSVFGTGYVQARILNIIFSLFALILVYVITKKYLSKRIALISTGLLGINISFLIYNKIALLETQLVVFLLLSIYFWSYAKKSILFLLLSILCFILAFLVKPLAILFLPTLLFMIIYEFRHFIKKKFLIVGAISSALVIILALILFPQIIDIFINFASSRHPGSISKFISLLSQFFYQDFFRINTILLFLFFGYLFYATTRWIAKKHLNTYEYIILTWTLGGLALLVLQTYRPARYFVTIIPPLCILAAIYLEKSIKYKKTAFHTLVLLVLSLLFANHFYYFFTLLSIPLIVFILFTFVLVSIAVFVLPRIKFSKGLRIFLLVLYILINISMVIIWFSSQSYSLYEASKDLESVVGEDKVVFGLNWAPALCLGTTLECYHVSGTFNEGEEAFRAFDVDYFLIDDYDQLIIDEVPFAQKSSFNASLSYIKSYQIGRFTIDLYSFNQSVYYSD